MHRHTPTTETPKSDEEKAMRIMIGIWEANSWLLPAMASSLQALVEYEPRFHRLRFERM